MFRQMLRAKIHRATVTEACLEYEGASRWMKICWMRRDSAVRSDRALQPQQRRAVYDLRHEGEAGKRARSC